MLKADARTADKNAIAPVSALRSRDTRLAVASALRNDCRIASWQAPRCRNVHISYSPLSELMLVFGAKLLILFQLSFSPSAGIAFSLLYEA